MNIKSGHPASTIVVTKNFFSNTKQTPLYVTMKITGIYRFYSSAPLTSYWLDVIKMYLVLFDICLFALITCDTLPNKYTEGLKNAKNENNYLIPTFLQTLATTRFTTFCTWRPYETNYYIISHVACTYTCIKNCCFSCII